MRIDFSATLRAWLMRALGISSPSLSLLEEMREEMRRAESEAYEPMPMDEFLEQAERIAYRAFGMWYEDDEEE